MFMANHRNGLNEIMDLQMLWEVEKTNQVGCYYYSYLDRLGLGKMGNTQVQRLCLTKS